MLIRHQTSRPERGFTLVELMIGILIMGILFSLAIPSFSDWIRNSKVRTAAESIRSGLQLARAEAVRRNTTVRFVLVNNACQPLGVGMNLASPSWLVTLDPPNGNCTIDPDRESPPRNIMFRSGAEGSGNDRKILVRNGASAEVVFNGMGRIPNGGAGGFSISYASETNDSSECKQYGGPVRCLDVQAEPGGAIFVCDWALPESDAQGCRGRGSV